MQVKTILAIMKIANRISNPSSLTSLYKSVEIGVESFRCCSEYGNISISTDKTGLSKECLIDCDLIHGVVNSLPLESEISLNEKHGQVYWECEGAKGHWSTVQTDHKIPEIDHSNYPWQPEVDFGDALLLASSACQAAAVSFGLYGIDLIPEQDVLKMISSNTIALAASSIKKGNFPGGKITLRPPVPEVLASLTRACPNAGIDITSEGLFIKGDKLAAKLPLGTPLTRDLLGWANQYISSEHIAKVNTSAINKFIARARVLSDRNVTFTVNLQIEDGKLILTHQGLSSGTEEYFLAEGLDPQIKYNQIALPADMLVFPLKYIEELVLDYLPANALVLRGSNPVFTYVVGSSRN